MRGDSVKRYSVASNCSSCCAVTAGWMVVRSAQNDNLQAMLQTLYGYWFLQFDFPDENGQPYRSSGGRMVWNNQLKREIPAGWRVGANEELFDGIRTGLNPRQNFSLRTQGIAYLTVKNLTKDGGLDFASCDYIDEEAMAKVRRRSDLRVGDILFASIAPLRRCFLIYEEPRDWEINESVFSIRPRRGVTTPEYVYCHLMSDAFVKQAEQSSTGSIFKGIRHETLKGLMTIIPPETIAQSFASAVSPVMRTRNDNLEENRKLQELRDWLLPMLMNGQATVASSDKLSFAARCSHRRRGNPSREQPPTCVLPIDGGRHEATTHRGRSTGHAQRARQRPAQATRIHPASRD